MDPTGGVMLDDVFGDEVTGDPLLRTASSASAPATCAAGPAPAASKTDPAVDFAGASDAGSADATAGRGGADAPTTPRTKAEVRAVAEEAVPQGVATPPRSGKQVNVYHRSLKSGSRGIFCQLDAMLCVVYIL